ncbi:MAG TPA: hypothetical protein GXX28_07405 [Firmicutes bacterium]|nr:hypothetical protein [Bacillota bacterium]
MKLRSLAILAAVAALMGLAVSSRAVVEATDTKACAQCHPKQVQEWTRSAHGAAGVSCASCHPAEKLHQPSPEAAVPDYSAEACAKCHDQEFREWKASAHNIPVPYAPDEIAPELITDCVRCHNVRGYVRVLRGPVPFAQSKGQVVDASSPGVTCSACHDPHASSPAMLRAGSPAQTCDHCHGDKWQNLVLNGTGGQRYPGSDYGKSAVSPHNTGDRCVACHMAKTPGVEAGGHTLKMKDAQGRLNLNGCLPCHQGIRDFNVGGKQAETQELLASLAETLKARNLGELPRNQPGKCNECHRGGTEPFRNDPNGILEQAFQNYRLFAFDRSLGVHNPAYTRQLLQESLQHVLQGYSGAPAPRGAEGCCGHQG